MPSLKRLHAQDGSISHGQPNNDGGEARQKGNAFGAERVQFKRGGGVERENRQWLLVSVNLGGPHTLKGLTWLAVLWLNVLCEGVSCPLLAGTARLFCPDEHPYLTHHTYRPLPGHQASSVEDLAKDTGETLLLVGLINPTSVLVPGRAAEGERRELKWGWWPDEHQQLSGIPRLCPFLTKVLRLMSVKWLPRMSGNIRPN